MPVVTGRGSLSLVKVSGSDGPGTWQLRVTGEGGSDVLSIDLTKTDLPKLRDLFSKAVVLEQGGGGAR